MNSFSFIDMTGQLLPTGVRVVQRVSRQPVRWLCKCEKCGSERVFDHARVIAAIQGAQGNVAQCDLSNCRLFGAAKKPVPPTARPEHAPVVASPLVTPAPAPARAAPRPVAPDPLRVDYGRFNNAQKHWGNTQLWSFDEFKRCREMKPDVVAGLMEQVEAYEADMKKQAEALRLGEELQRQWEAEFFSKYDIRVAVNLGGTIE